MADGHVLKVAIKIIIVFVLDAGEFIKDVEEPLDLCDVVIF